MKKIRQILAAVLCLTTIIAGMALTPKTTGAAGSKLTGMTAEQIVDMMGVGINVGNSLDATGGSYINGYTQEMAWGNALISQELMNSIVKEGFTCVRIPCTWYKYLSDDGTYTIREDFLDRVQEVVDYCFNAGLFVILNVMHEDFIENEFLVRDEIEIGNELSAVWSQIADRFAGYDQHLIFESMNEPRAKGTGAEWQGSAEGRATINYLNQIFANTIRCNGKGYNRERCLMVPGYAASSSYSCLQAISLPTYHGEVVNNIIVSVHSYTPYNFCLSDDASVFVQSGKNEIDRVYADIKKCFLDYGIPVVMGETGATNTQENIAEREKWAEYFTSVSAKHGVPILLWDNGNNKTIGGECHAYINRKTAEWYPKYEGIAKAFINGFKNAEWKSALAEVPQQGAENVTFYANGKIWASGNEMPESPSYFFMNFEGWYTTPDYRPGTELDLSKPHGAINAYAKYSLNLEDVGLVDHGNGMSGSVQKLMLYIGIGVGALGVVAVMILLICGKKRSKKAE